MDNPGWHARRRAAHENVNANHQRLSPPRTEIHPFQDSYLYGPAHRGPDGRYQPAEEELAPMQDNFIGGFHRSSRRSDAPGHAPPQAPAVGAEHVSSLSQDELLTLNLMNLTATERSQALRSRIARMRPELQFMVGPLLRYDTV